VEASQEVKVKDKRSDFFFGMFLIATGNIVFWYYI
jgi:hypothetical protein